VRVPVGGTFAARGAAGTMLHVRAGVIGERAYDVNAAEVSIRVSADRVPLGELEVPRTARDGTGWRRLDVALPAGAPERDFAFAATSRDPGRPLCLAAWTTR
jgi:hypothetical protein